MLPNPIIDAAGAGGPWNDHKGVGAHAGHGTLDSDRRAVAYLRHRDDRRDAYDNAKGSKHCPHDIASKGIQGRFQDTIPIHTSSRGSHIPVLFSISPSLM